MFERVLHGNEAILIEKDEGEVVMLKPAASRTLRGRKKTEADYKAFRSSAGGWADIDTDTLIENIYKSRDVQWSREQSRARGQLIPPIDLFIGQQPFTTSLLS